MLGERDWPGAHIWRNCWPPTRKAKKTKGGGKLVEECILAERAVFRLLEDLRIRIYLQRRAKKAVAVRKLFQERHILSREILEGEGAGLKKAGRRFLRIIRESVNC